MVLTYLIIFLFLLFSFIIYSLSFDIIHFLTGTPYFYIGETETILRIHVPEILVIKDITFK